MTLFLVYDNLILLIKLLDSALFIFDFVYLLRLIKSYSSIGIWLKARREAKK